MAVTFKCLTSGQTVTFVNQVDIDSMKGHAGYEVVPEQQEASTKEVLSTPAKKTTGKKPSTEE